MARTKFATGNPSGKEVGPVLVAADTEIAAVEVREQAGHGLIDARFHFRNTDGSTIPGNPVSDWLTDNNSATRTGTVLIPNDEEFAGLIVVEQAGYGVVNLRVKKRKRADKSAAPATDLVVSNGNATATHDLDISNTATGRGLVGREQAGHGIIDLAIDFHEGGP